MEIVQAIIAAAEAENSPVIIQASQGAIKYAGLDYIVAFVTTAAKTRDSCLFTFRSGVLISQVVRCIAKGFSSVMFGF